MIVCQPVFDLRRSLTVFCTLVVGLSLGDGLAQEEGPGLDSLAPIGAFLDGVASDVSAVGGSGETITLKLAGPSTAKTLTYIKGGKWKQEQAIIWGSNNVAALTFCEVPIRPARSHEE